VVPSPRIWYKVYRALTWSRSAGGFGETVSRQMLFSPGLSDKTARIGRLVLTWEEHSIRALPAYTFQYRADSTEETSSWISRRFILSLGMLCDAGAWQSCIRSVAMR